MSTHDGMCSPSLSLGLDDAGHPILMLFLVFSCFLTVHLARVQHPLLLRLRWHDRPIRAQPRDRPGRFGTLSQVPAV